MKKWAQQTYDTYEDALIGRAREAALVRPSRYRTEVVVWRWHRVVMGQLRERVNLP